MLDQQPELDDCGLDIIRCWNTCDSERSVANGVGLIPFRAVIAWAELQRWDREATVLLVDVISYLDQNRAERERSERVLKGATS